MVSVRVTDVQRQSYKNGQSYKCPVDTPTSTIFDALLFQDVL